MKIANVSVAPLIAIAIAVCFASETAADEILMDSVLFDFNDLAANINSTSGADPIETYMEALWGSDITIALGAKTQKNRIESRPHGAYLGNSDGATESGDCVEPSCHSGPKDTFLINRWNTTSIPESLRDRIIITFEVEPIMGFQVDWEIFPVTEHGQNADITIKADGEILFFSELLGEDKELGDLGHFGYIFSTPVHTLEFIDWSDAPIGIDNLHVSRRVPLPATAPLLITGLVGLFLERALRRNRV